MAQQPQHGDGNLNLLYKIASNTYDISQNGGSPGDLGTMSTQDADNVDITGGAISGVTINAESLEVGNAVTADLYVGPDGNVGIGTETTTEKLTIAGNIDISNGQIKNLGVPLDDTDAATKLYVDTAVVGSVGATGATGLQGDTGATGFDGATGLQGATGLTGAGGASGFWGSFWSNQDQSAANTTTAYPITFNNTDPDSIGVSVVSNSRITFANAGVYNIQFSVQADRISGSGSDNIDIWFRKNGIDIAESNGVVTVAGGAAAAKTIASWNYMLKLSAGDYVELVWRTSDTNLQLIHEDSASSPTRPAIPSVIVTAQQVMNTQLGATGATGPTATPTDVQIFTTPGAFTWTKPVGAKKVKIELVGGGGGGGSGTKQATISNRFGGGGGSSATVSVYEFDESSFPNSPAVVSGVVGSGGLGGAARTVDGQNGLSGDAGNDTIFANVRASGGNLGSGGTTTGGAGGIVKTTGVFAGAQGGNSSVTTTAGNGGAAVYTSAAGAGGGIDAATNTPRSGGTGGTVLSSLIASAAIGTAGDAHGYITTLGFGGGGGTAALTGVAQSGGNGGLYGGGGGGGGATTNGVGNTSGAGGDGGNGIAIITTYF